MSVRSIEGLQRYLRRLCEQAGPLDDAVLLNRFVAANDREAFDLLVARHGPMVLGTARRLVDTTHDAEDVFQAVFLSLARLANSIRTGRTLPAWLHRTTFRVAAKVRKQRSIAAPAASADPCDTRDPHAQLVWHEVRQALDEELQALPDRWRAPLVLCYLSGLTRDEAARQLGWSLGTLKRRLEEARKALRARLERRGIAAVGLALAVLTPESLQAAVARSLFDATVHLVLTPRAVVPATIAALVISSASTTKGLVMQSLFALLAAIALGVGIHAGAGQTDPPGKAEGKQAEEKVVQVEDPLPAGSVLRFGTARFRQGVAIVAMALSHDGKTAYVVNGTSFGGCTRAFDLETGRALFTLENDQAEGIALAPDGQTFVTKQSQRLQVHDAKTGRQLRSMELTKANPWSSADVLAFTPDGRAVATITDGKVVHLIDYESGKPIRDFPHEGWGAIGVAFSPDGRRLAAGGYDKDNENYFVRLWDVATGKEIRRFQHGKQGYGIRNLAISPDGKTLATGGDGAIVRLFEVDTGKELRTLPKNGGRMRHGCVTFAPDGKSVAVAGGSLCVYDVATGEERLRIDRKASHIQFTEGGKTLTGAVSGAIYRWDTATGKPLTPDAGDSVVAQVLVSADGRRVVTRGYEGDAHVWDGGTGRHLRRIQAVWQQNVALSADGRFLAWPVSDSKVTYTLPGEPGSIYDGSRIVLYDLARDKIVDRFPAFKGNATDLMFTGDGKKLVTVASHGGVVRTWDVASGKEERQFSVMPAAPKGKTLRVGRTILSPDGRTVALTYEEHDGGRVDRLGRGLDQPHLVRVWDVATGKVLPELTSGYPIDGAFSPDGRLVVTNSGNGVHDTATGQRVAALPDELYVRAAAFSRDGRHLATAVSGGVIQIWEVATWTKRNEFKGYRDQSVVLAFTPGGQLLTGGVDTTVLAWDTRPPRVGEGVTLDRAWDDLTAKDASVSFRSEGRFQASPADAVKLFGEKVKLAEALDAKRIERLLADLGSDEFAAREAASKALHGLDEQVVPHLEATLKRTESTEVRVRVRRILEQRQRAGLPADQLRQIRAVTVLERIGDGEAKALLRRWAGGPEGARLTLDAAAALRRLEGR